MRLKNVSNKAHVLHLHNMEILFSYEVPVAAFIYKTGDYVVSATHYSRTTTKHVDDFILNCEHQIVEQDVLDNVYWRFA